MSAPFNEFGPFAVGEVCTIIGARHFPELIGSDVTITSPLGWYTNMLDGGVYQAYDVDLRHLGYNVAVPERFLRRRKPPTTDSSERAFMDQIRKLADKAPQLVGEPA